MKKILLASLAAGALASVPVRANLLVEVGYDFGVTSVNSTPAYSASPDSGFVKISAMGGSTFVGELKLLAPYPGGDYNTGTGPGYSLGASVTLVPGPESSNVGGFNGVGGGNPDNGIQLSIVGLLDGVPLNYQIYDKDIHSGTFATNPYGITLDNYILQGGDPYGRDTGDDFEVHQAHAFFTIPSRMPDSGSTLSLLGLAVGGLALARRKK